VAAEPPDQSIGPIAAEGERSRRQQGLSAIVYAVDAPRPHPCEPFSMMLYERGFAVKGPESRPLAQGDGRKQAPQIRARLEPDRMTPCHKAILIAIRFAT
jgi:hypothetical protein